MALVASLAVICKLCGQELKIYHQQEHDVKAGHTSCLSIWLSGNLSFWVSIWDDLSSMQGYPYGSAIWAKENTHSGKCTTPEWTGASDVWAKSRQYEVIISQSGREVQCCWIYNVQETYCAWRVWQSCRHALKRVCKHSCYLFKFAWIVLNLEGIGWLVAFLRIDVPFLIPLLDYRSRYALSSFSQKAAWWQTNRWSTAQIDLKNGLGMILIIACDRSAHL